MSTGTNASAADLERRKHVRIRLRPDVALIKQKYEGRTYHVVKDPVSLRYYRFKEQERFLLDLMDGTHTLEDCQKQFEERFRPDRLTLEDLEAFASQLLQAGLAQNESPAAGKQLFDRFKKRRRSAWMQAVLNILYIKLPLFDPDRLLIRMLDPTRFIFTYWFLTLSIATMLTALSLVLSHWNDFRNKLPEAHEFFSFTTVAYLWVALGAVKIIHEFGHGLSCKAYGGEVHEMGALFLCLSPCLYCNVSDSWTIPSKWKRIVIAAAGIYVELIIASIATFIWWSTASGTFINNMCLSLIIVCSISTIIFNANPLMRFDGYYILSDWLEIPNLRERSNQFLKWVFMEYCLGMETQPQPYMTMSRKFLFVSYAVGSWIYRWVITFSVLYFMYTFLEPYKLGSISFLLGTGALGSMVGYPIYNLIKAYRKRGRVPDMNSWRVGLTMTVAAAAVVVVFTVPFPMRVKGLAVIQIDPAHVMRVTVPARGGFLAELRVEDGQTVRRGDILAVLTNPDLDMQLKLVERDSQLRKEHLGALNSQVGPTSGRFAEEREVTATTLAVVRQQQQSLLEQRELLTLRAPRDGVVVHLLAKTEIGRLQKPGAEVCQIGDPLELRAIFLVPPQDRSLVEDNLVVEGKSEAWIRVHGLRYNYWHGWVDHIAPQNAKEIPPQLSYKAGGDVVTQQDPESKLERPQQQQYVIAVRFDESEREEAGKRVHPGVLGRVKISAEPRTLGWRLYRYLRTNFSLGL
jgi:putative peptide zinc metalloprotease protein